MSKWKLKPLLHQWIGMEYINLLLHSTMLKSPTGLEQPNCPATCSDCLSGPFRFFIIVKNNHFILRAPRTSVVLQFLKYLPWTGLLYLCTSSVPPKWNILKCCKSGTTEENSFWYTNLLNYAYRRWTQGHFREHRFFFLSTNWPLY